MRSFFGIRILILALAALLSARADDARRIFDFTPVSAVNPVVATIDGGIEIPLSELRGFRDAEKLKAITDPASVGQKRAVLDALVDEYLLVDQAYREGVVESPGFSRQMAATRTMMLTDFMAMRAAREPSNMTAAQSDAGAALAEKLFDDAKIEVSNEAHAVLKQSAQAVDAARGTREEVQSRLHAIVMNTPDAVLVRYEGRSISIRQVLAIYAGLPAEKRPRVQTESGLVDLFKPLILPELMAIEATKRGIEGDPLFQQKFIQNRNALLRFHAQGMVERQANELMRAPDIEDRLREWHAAHHAAYVRIENGQRREATFAEARTQVEGDYSVAVRDRLLAERVAALRRQRDVRIDEKILAAL